MNAKIPSSRICSIDKSEYSFVCSYCKNFSNLIAHLSSSDYLNICNNCIEKEQTTQLKIYPNQELKLISFENPHKVYFHCKFSELGCNQILSLNELEKHENDCLFQCNPEIQIKGDINLSVSSKFTPIELIQIDENKNKIHTSIEHFNNQTLFDENMMEVSNKNQIDHKKDEKFSILESANINHNRSINNQIYSNSISQYPNEFNMLLSNNDLFGKINSNNKEIKKPEESSIPIIYQENSNVSNSEINGINLKNHENRTISKEDSVSESTRKIEDIGYNYNLENELSNIAYNSFEIKLFELYELIKTEYIDYVKNEIKYLKKEYPVVKDHSENNVVSSEFNKRYDLYNTIASKNSEIIEAMEKRIKHLEEGFDKTNMIPDKNKNIDHNLMDNQLYNTNVVVQIPSKKSLNIESVNFINRPGNLEFHNNITKSIDDHNNKESDIISGKEKIGFCGNYLQDSDEGSESLEIKNSKNNNLNNEHLKEFDLKKNDQANFNFDILSNRINLLYNFLELQETIENNPSNNNLSIRIKNEANKIEKLIEEKLENLFQQNIIKNMNANSLKIQAKDNNNLNSESTMINSDMLITFMDEINQKIQVMQQNIDNMNNFYFSKQIPENFAKKESITNSNLIQEVMPNKNKTDTFHDDFLIIKNQVEIAFQGYLKGIDNLNSKSLVKDIEFVDFKIRDLEQLYNNCCQKCSILLNLKNALNCFDCNNLLCKFCCSHCTICRRFFCNNKGRKCFNCNSFMCNKCLSLESNYNFVVGNLICIKCDKYFCNKCIGICTFFLGNHCTKCLRFCFTTKNSNFNIEIKNREKKKRYLDYSYDKLKLETFDSFCQYIKLSVGLLSINISHNNQLNAQSFKLFIDSIANHPTLIKFYACDLNVMLTDMILIVNSQLEGIQCLKKFYMNGNADIHSTKISLALLNIWHYYAIDYTMNQNKKKSKGSRYSKNSFTKFIRLAYISNEI